MQDSSESLKDGVVGLGAVFGQKEPDFTHETDRDFDRIVGRAVEAEKKNLESDNLVCDVLVAEVSDECRRGVANDLQVSAFGQSHEWS